MKGFLRKTVCAFLGTDPRKVSGSMGMLIKGKMRERILQSWPKKQSGNIQEREDCLSQAVFNWQMYF